MYSSLSLGGLSAAQFLQDYWQQRPLLIRQALPAYQSPVSPEELAGLACEEDVESRLIQEHGPQGPWQLQHGPLDEQSFAALPASHWTLLIQEINKHIPEFALLQEPFNFIPNWRLDDVMVSFAPEAGTVGPHRDNYDVFLLQAQGRRRWQIDTRPEQAGELTPNLPLKIMHSFAAEQEWVMEPGDMLYLPPGVAHHGVALEDCITVSIGFRAPSIAELCAAYCTDRIAQIPAERFYSDPALSLQENPGQIEPKAIEAIRQQVLSALQADEQDFAQWFGSFITDIRPGHYLPEAEPQLDVDTFVQQVRAWGELWRSEYARFAYLEQEVTTLCVAGETITVPPDFQPLVKRLCAQRHFTLPELAPWLEQDDACELLCQLYNLGALYMPLDDE